MENLRHAAPVYLPGPVEATSETKFDFWGVLNRRKWIVFLGLVAGLVVGTLIHYRTPEQFQSTAVIRIEPKDPNILYLQKNRTNVMPEASDVLPTRHDKFIAAKEMIKLCMDAGKLYSLTSFQNLTHDEAVLSVFDNLTVTIDRDDPTIYRIEFIALDKQDSRTVVTQLVDTYQRFMDARFSGATTNVVSMLKEMRSQFQEQYDAIRVRVAELSEMDPPRVDQFGRDIFSIELTQTKSRIDNARTELDALNARKERIIAALNSGEDAIESMLWTLQHEKAIALEPKENWMRFGMDEKLNQMIMDLESKLQGMYERGYRMGHPAYKTSHDYLNRLKAYREEKLKSLSAGNTKLEPATLLQRFTMEILEPKIYELNERLGVDLQMYARLEDEVRKVVRIREARAELERDRAHMEGLLNEIVTKIREIDPTGELAHLKRFEGYYFQPLENADQGLKVWPVLPVLLGIGGLIGALCGFGLGCLVDIADRTFHNPDEIIKRLSLPLIGHIPVINQSKRYQVENSLVDSVICTYHRPKSQNSEAFRAIRTALFFNSQDRENTVIQVTSPTPGDGKTTVAANLAVSIAQSGKRVLLVDGDMRRPRMGSIFGVSSKEGFATVLSGETKWQDVVFEVEEIEGLSVMPCGVKPSNPAELSSSPLVKQLIAQMRAEYDFVVIDTPPVLAVTDPCPVAARVDGVILAIRIKKNVRTSAERSVEILRNLGANIVGVVVNGVGAQSGYGSQYTYSAYRSGYAYNEYGYGYGYGYGNYYQEDAKKTNGKPKLIAAEAKSSAETTSKDLDIEE
ncbi:MAG TPA: polysaccharide biosynthesis tyrosine autokinase [Pirellulaceae bacterium]|nr:polysaccharide biosynthesis tyrosine autokinase [Pirellulaceae bacterium]